MIGFDGVVGILLGDMAGGGQQFVEDTGVGRGPVSGHLARANAVLKGAGKEPMGGRQIPLPGHQHVDDLAVLVDRPVKIGPAPGDFHIGFVDEPAITGDMPAGSGGVDEQWGKPLHPAIDGDVIHLDAPLGRQLLDVTVGEPVAQVPAHSHRDHLR